MMSTRFSRSASSNETVMPEVFETGFRAQLGSALDGELTAEGLKMRRMHRRPASRHVFSCEVTIIDRMTGKQSSIELIGKRDTARAAGKAAREFEALRQLREAGFGVDQRFRIPLNIQHFPDLHLILQGKVRGYRLRARLGKGDHDSLGYACMAGLWLAKLHNLNLSPSVTCKYENEIASLRTFIAALRIDQPGLADDLGRRAERLEEIFASLEGVPATMVHGDFHPDHIFVARHCITVIDFERFCAGDPARDLGSFIAHMRIIACSSGRELDAANEEIDAFLGSYFGAIAVGERAAIATRIVPYVALSSLEALYYIASVLKIADPGRIAPYVACVRQAKLLSTPFAPVHWREPASDKAE